MKILKNKYFLTSLIFIVWLLFFDDYNLISGTKNHLELKNLVRQQEYYKEKIHSDQLKLKELNSGPAELEKYAREEFYMSKPNEDVYILNGK